MPSCSCSSSAWLPSGRTATTRRACGRSVRKVSEPWYGCRPRTPCGSPWSPRTIRSSSSRGTGRSVGVVTAAPPISGAGSPAAPPTASLTAVVAVWAAVFVAVFAAPAALVAAWVAVFAAVLATLVAVLVVLLAVLPAVLVADWAVFVVAFLVPAFLVAAFFAVAGGGPASVPASGVASAAVPVVGAGVPPTSA